MRWLQHFDRSCNACLDCRESQDRLRKQRRATQKRGWEMNIWDNILGICSSSCTTAESLGEAAEAQSWEGFIRGLQLCAGWLCWGKGWSEWLAVLLPGGSSAAPWQLCWWQGAPPSCWPGAAFPAHLEAIWSWARLGLGLGLLGLRWKDASETQPCLGAGETLVPLKLPWTLPDPQG